MKNHILTLFYAYRPDREPDQFMSTEEQFDMLPWFLRQMVEEWIENYVELGGPREFCSRQVAALLFMIWKKQYNDYQ